MLAYFQITTCVVLLQDKKYTFDMIYQSNASQGEVYKGAANSIVKGIMLLKFI
jgi:hypothetical protein